MLLDQLELEQLELERLRWSSRRRRDKGNIHSYLKMPKCETGWWFQSELRIHEHLELDQSPIRLQSGTGQLGKYMGCEIRVCVMRVLYEEEGVYMRRMLNRGVCALYEEEGGLYEGYVESGCVFYEEEEGLRC